jgi:hypothetical protein
MKYAPLILLALLLPACRIGSGFDSAEKRRNLIWEDQMIEVSTEQPPPVEPEPKLSPPIVYLLVAG